RRAPGLASSARTCALRTAPAPWPWRWPSSPAATTAWSWPWPATATRHSRSSTTCGCSPAPACRCCISPTGKPCPTTCSVRTRALAVAAPARGHDGLALAVARDSHAAQSLEHDLRVFAGPGLPVLHFADWETLPYDLFSPHPDIVSQRISALSRLPTQKRGVL